MFKDFIFNASLLIASFYIMGQIFKDRPLERSSSISTKLYWGIAYGVLGIVLMIFSIKINSTVIADLRHLAIIIPAAFGGFFPAFITGLIIAVGRLLLLGISETSLIAASGALLIGGRLRTFFKIEIKHHIESLLYEPYRFNYYFHCINHHHQRS